MNDIDLKIARKTLRFTQQMLADYLDVSKSLIQKWESGDRIPDVVFVDKIKEAVQKHTEGILDYDIEIKKNNTRSKNVTSLTTYKEGVPYYDMDFAGGWDSEEVFANQTPSFYITSPDFTKAEFACNLIGNSISNRIPSGAVIGLREIFDWQTYFPTNELYGVLTKNDLRTVKIVKRSKKEGYLELIPDPKQIHNQTEYEMEEIPINFITKFFQVVAWAQFERVAM